MKLRIVAALCKCKYMGIGVNNSMEYDETHNGA